MKKIILLFLLFPVFVFGQGWERTYGEAYDDEGTSVCQTNDGDFVLTGQTLSDILILKTNLYGDTLWSKRYGNPHYDFGKEIKQTSDGGFIIIGSTGSVGGWDYNLYVIKTDINGSLVWSRVFGGSGFDYGHSILETDDGEFLVAGSTYSYGNGQSDFYIIKLGANGDEIWAKTYGGEEEDICYSIVETDDGDFVLAGTTKSFAIESYDVYLIKINSDGNELWSNSYDGGFRDEANQIQQTSDLGFIITGVTGGNGEEVLLLKTNNYGEVLWSKSIGGVDGDVGYSVQETSDFGYIITGTTWSYGNGAVDVFLVKTDSNGNQLWYKTFGGPEWDGGNCVIQTEDGGYILTGYTMSYGAGETDVYLVKTDSEGNITSTNEIPLPYPNRKLIKTIDLQGREIQPRENIPYIEVYDDGSTEKKVIVK